MEAVKQGTREWLELRAGKITSSEVHKIMAKAKDGGLGETAKSYLLKKVSEQLVGYQDTFVNTAMAWGIENESLARANFEKRTGLEVSECGFFSYGGFAGGSPDGLIGSNSIIEIKCPFETSKHLEYCMIESDSDIPKEYYYQIQMNMMVTDTNGCYFISFDPRIDHECGLFIHNVYRNDEVIEQIQGRLILANDFIKTVKQKLNI